MIGLKCYFCHKPFKGNVHDPVTKYQYCRHHEDAIEVCHVYEQVDHDNSYRVYLRNIRIAYKLNGILYQIFIPMVDLLGLQRESVEISYYSITNKYEILYMGKAPQNLTFESIIHFAKQIINLKAFL